MSTSRRIALRILRLLPVVAILALGYAVVWSAWQPPPPPEPVDRYGGEFAGCSSDPDHLEGNGGIELPPSAADVMVCSTGTNDLFTQGRFTMDAGDLAALQAGSVCAKPLVAVDPADYPAGPADPEWWRPGDARTLLACVGIGRDVLQEVLVDTSDPARYIVYVSADTR